jgi:hypothetical protein
MVCGRFSHRIYVAYSITQHCSTNCFLLLLVLMVCGRFSHRIYVAYSTVYTLGTLLSMQERLIMALVQFNVCVRKLRLIPEGKYTFTIYSSEQVMGIKYRYMWILKRS